MKVLFECAKGHQWVARQFGDDDTCPGDIVATLTPCPVCHPPEQTYENRLGSLEELVQNLGEAEVGAAAVMALLARRWKPRGIEELSYGPITVEMVAEMLCQASDWLGESWEEKTRRGVTSSYLREARAVIRLLDEIGGTVPDESGVLHWWAGTCLGRTEAFTNRTPDDWHAKLMELAKEQ